MVYMITYEANHIFLHFFLVVEECLIEKCKLLKILNNSVHYYILLKRKRALFLKFLNILFGITEF